MFAETIILGTSTHHAISASSGEVPAVLSAKTAEFFQCVIGTCFRAVSVSLDELVARIAQRDQGWRRLSRKEHVAAIFRVVHAVRGSSTGNAFVVIAKQDFLSQFTP